MAETITVDQIDEFFRDIVRTFHAVDYTPYLEQELEELERIHNEYFQKDVDPEGVQWPALAPSTVRRKGHRRILEDTMALRESLTGTTGDSVRTIISDGGLRGLAFGTMVEYSLFHDRPFGNRPARIHVGINDGHLDAIAGRAVEFTIEKMKR